MFILIVFKIPNRHRRIIYKVFCLLRTTVTVSLRISLP